LLPIARNSTTFFAFLYCLIKFFIIYPFTVVTANQSFKADCKQPP